MGGRRTLVRARPRTEVRNRGANAADAAGDGQVRKEASQLTGMFGTIRGIALGHLTRLRLGHPPGSTAMRSDRPGRVLP